MRMNAAETSASSAIADCTPLTVVSRSRTTAEIDTFISEVSTTSTNIAIASRSGSLGDVGAIARRPSAAVLVQTLRQDDPGGSLEQREVREGLREVAQMPAGRGVELLRVEPERRGDPQQTLHQVARALELTDHGQAG